MTSSCFRSSDERANRLDSLLENVGRVEKLFLQVDLAAGDPRDVEQVVDQCVDQLLKPKCIAMDQIEPFALRGAGRLRERRLQPDRESARGVYGTRG